MTAWEYRAAWSGAEPGGIKTHEALGVPRSPRVRSINLSLQRRAKGAVLAPPTEDETGSGIRDTPASQLPPAGPAALTSRGSHQR